MAKKIVVVGMGYVGIPVAAKFADAGLSVVGIDIDENKIKELNNGRYPLKGREPGIQELIKTVVNRGFFKATNDFTECRNADAILITVATPFNTKTMEPNYSALISAVKEIGKNLSKNTLVIVESTIAPKTMDNVVKPLLEKQSCLHVGTDFFLGHCPERVMPGKLLYNLINMDRVLGGINEKSCLLMKELYSMIIKGNLYLTDMVTAEVVKTTENAYRDVQIAFANEVALICEKLGVDAYIVRELVNKSPERNMHVPGSGVGGHCIPKDTLLLAYPVKNILNTKFLFDARERNDSMPLHVVDLVEDALKEAKKKIKHARISILGAAYLPNSDDTRNSPTIPVIRTLRKKQADIFIHDPFVDELEGINISKDLNAVLLDADCLIVMTAHDMYRDITVDMIKKLMKTPVIVDGRNLFSKEECLKKKVIFRGIGR